MSPAPASRSLLRVPVPPGAEGPALLLPALAAALDGSGPAVTPVPTVSTAVSNDYVMSVLAAVRPDLPLESDEVAAVVATSGSTGSPRGVLLTAAQLTALTEVVNGTDTSPQWIVALPVTSMGGLNVLVRALATGREPVVVPSIGGAGPFTSTDFAGAVAAATRRSADVRVSLVPAQLSRLLADDRGIDALRQCTAVLVGAAATRPSLRQNAQALGIALITTYGATETAGGCVFDGHPLPGVSVTSDGAPGPLTVAGPCVAMGYRAEPELTRRTFDDGAFRTGDIGFVDVDGTVRVIGRADDVVVIRGVNVSPLAVERVISDLPDVVTAAVVSAEPRDGEPVLHAFVEMRDGVLDAQGLVAEAVTTRLGVHARPLVRLVDRLPHLPNGKVDRRVLQQWAIDEGTT